MNKPQHVDEYAQTLVLPDNRKPRAEAAEPAANGDQQELYSEYVQELERELKSVSRRR